METKGFLIRNKLNRNRKYTAYGTACVLYNRVNCSNPAYKNIHFVTT